LQSAPGTPTRMQEVRQLIPAGQSRLIDTGRKLTSRQAQQIKVTIINADIVR